MIFPDSANPILTKIYDLISGTKYMPDLDNCLEMIERNKNKLKTSEVDFLLFILNNQTQIIKEIILKNYN